VVIGKLVSGSDFSGYSSVRLPIADLPAAIRDADANLRFQPTLQLQRMSPGEVVKVGARVISIHNLAPYVGWGGFEVRIEAMVSALERALGEIHVSRLGLRYINSLSPAQGFRDIEDVNILLEVAGERPSKEFTTTYRSYSEQNLASQVIVASPSFVAGTPPAGSVAFVDVDIFSRTSPGKMTGGDIQAWFNSAHDLEKNEFFKLWRPGTLAEQRLD
jgi:uncharacterized protein (TIGR04255 family)